MKIYFSLLKFSSEVQELIIAFSMMSPFQKKRIAYVTDNINIKSLSDKSAMVTDVHLFMLVHREQTEDATFITCQACLSSCWKHESGIPYGWNSFSKNVAEASMFLLVSSK